MLVRVSASALKNGRWHEYFIRFALGGAVTVLTGWIANRFGPSIGGLFLAVPAIFCASATLIEKHEMRRKSEAGMDGRRRGQQAAALDATGAALGSFGLARVRGVLPLAHSSSRPMTDHQVGGRRPGDDSHSSKSAAVRYRWADRSKVSRSLSDRSTCAALRHS